MKKEIRYAFFLISLFIFAAASIRAQDASLPTLRGGAAVEKLKQAGLYESLSEAVKAARTGKTTTADAAVQTAKLIGSDGANGDNFGFSLSIEGNTAVAGALGDDLGENDGQGSVFVFVRSGTVWTQQQKLVASDGAEGDRFGASVALDGNTIVVGAADNEVGANLNQGAAYVFTRSGTVWTQQQKLTASDGEPVDFFGLSVAISGETVIVGALDDDVGALGDCGSAYVFTRSGTVWTEQQRLTASDGANGDNFGSVAISGNTALVSAKNDDVGGNLNQGSAYVFVRSGTVWTEQQKLVASDGAANDNFGNGGWTIGIDGDTVVVGSNNDDVGANFDQGSAYVFVRSGAVWTQQAHLFASDGSQLCNFGTVAIEGDTIVVGAFQDNVGFNPDQGSVYVFTRSGAIWTERQKLIASDGAEGDNFGLGVAISGNKIFIGAFSANIGMQNDQGVAYVFISGVSVSGRVTTAGGYGVAKATVQITLANGETRYTLTSPFGYYRFDEIEADQTATVSVISKQFQFTPQMVTLSNNLTNIDFMAQ
jgi:hypothetical protein